MTVTALREWLQRATREPDRRIAADTVTETEAAVIWSLYCDCPARFLSDVARSMGQDVKTIRKHRDRALRKLRRVWRQLPIRRCSRLMLALIGGWESGHKESDCQDCSSCSLCLADPSQVD